MVHIAGEIVINRPLDEVFDFVADARNEPRYNPRVLRVEQISDGPIGLGTRFRDEAKGLGRPVEILIEFTDFERPRRIAESISVSGTDIRGMLTFAPVLTGTRMQWSWEVQPHGLLKLMSPLIAQLGRRQEKATWTGLKQYLEGRTTPVLQT